MTTIWHWNGTGRSWATGEFFDFLLFLLILSFLLFFYILCNFPQFFKFLKLFKKFKNQKVKRKFKKNYLLICIRIFPNQSRHIKIFRSSEKYMSLRLKEQEECTKTKTKGKQTSAPNQGAIVPSSVEKSAEKKTPKGWYRIYSMMSKND